MHDNNLLMSYNLSVTGAIFLQNKEFNFNEYISLMYK